MLVISFCFTCVLVKLPVISILLAHAVTRPVLPVYLVKLPIIKERMTSGYLRHCLKINLLTRRESDCIHIGSHDSAASSQDIAVGSHENTVLFLVKPDQV